VGFAIDLSTLESAPALEPHLVIFRQSQRVISAQARRSSGERRRRRLALQRGFGGGRDGRGSDKSRSGMRRMFDDCARQQRRGANRAGES